MADKKIVMTTCYDATFAKICAKAQCLDYILVGDSMGMVVYGHESTTKVTLRQMEEHIQAVNRGLKKSLQEKLPTLIADLPAGTYETPEQAIDSAKRLINAGAEIVKLEGPVTEVASALDAEGLRVCGHIGLTPQSITEYKLQGRSSEDANRLFKEAKELETAGCEMLVLEMIPAPLAKEITEAIHIPTIGIGAGPHCDGQVLVLYDLLGMNLDFKPKFLKNFSKLEDVVSGALQEYANEVEASKYPADANSFF